MFRLNRNERSHWSGNGVHVESELVFMIGRNMQIAQVAQIPGVEEQPAKMNIVIIYADAAIMHRSH